jgi:hypothetical protein
MRHSTIFSILFFPIAFLVGCQPSGSDDLAETESITSFAIDETAYNVQGFWDFELDGQNDVTSNSSFVLGLASVDSGLLTSEGVYGYLSTEDTFVQDTLFDFNQMTLAIRFKHANILHSDWEPVIVGHFEAFRDVVLENQGGTYRLSLKNRDVYMNYSTPVSSGWHTAIITIDVQAQRMGFQLDEQDAITEALPSGFAFENVSLSHEDSHKITIQHNSTAERFHGEVDWIVWINGIVQPDTVAQIVSDYQ